LSNNKVYAKIMFKDLSLEVSGEPEDVIKTIIKWMGKVLPGFDLFKELSVDVDYIELSKSLSKYVMVSEDGEIIFREPSPKRLALSNKILIALGIAKLIHLAGKSDNPYLSLRELTMVLGKPSKTISSRLSELHYDGYVKRIRSSSGVHYEISVKGLIKLINL